MRIALRKSTHSCTQHPIANFISYTTSSPAFQALTEKVSAVEVPKSIQEALNHPEWRKAVEKEMYASRKNETWEIVDLPDGKFLRGVNGYLISSTDRMEILKGIKLIWLQKDLHNLLE